MSMIRAFLLVLSCMCVLVSIAQRTTRPGLKVDPRGNNKSVTIADTIYISEADDFSSLQLSGYEKTLRSRKESFLISNCTEDTIVGVNVTIDYYDISMRQLHQRDIALKCLIPPAQTRMVEFKSWDPQLVWYYYLSHKPRTNGQATPYKVRITPNYYLR